MSAVPPVTPAKNLNHSRPESTADRPRAILFVKERSYASVCAWCFDKPAADAWCRDRGFDATHTICPACRDRLEFEAELATQQGVA